MHFERGRNSILYKSQFFSIRIFSTILLFEIFKNHFLEIRVVDPGKLDLRQKQIILLSRIAILLLKGKFGREKINFYEKNLKYRKIILLINFIFAPTFFLIAYQILKNYAILINHELFFQEKVSLQLIHFQFSKMNKLSKILEFVYKNFVLENVFGIYF